MKSHRDWLIRLAFIAIFFISSLIIAEVGARLFIVVFGPSEKLKDVYRDAIKKDTESYAGPARPIAHPFFGFVNTLETPTSHPAGQVNNMGFFDSEIYPYRKSDSEFVIGLFGGSVAMSLRWLMSRPEGLEELRKAFPEAGKRPIKVLNFAMGCYKQPQQFFVSSFFLGSYDVALNIDGYNEAVFVRPHMIPESVCWMENLFSQSFGSKDLRYQIGQLKSWWKLVTVRLERSAWLSQSAFVHLIWRSFDRVWQEVIHQVRFENQGERPPPSFYFNDNPSMEVAVANGAANWERYTRLQSQLLTANKVPAYFFIQPNQHVLGSKPLHPSELAIWKDIPGMEQRARELNSGYALIRHSGDRLQAEGVRVADLSMIFKDVSEPLYIDDCCHLNNQGQEALFKAIVSRIQELNRPRR